MIVMSNPGKVALLDSERALLNTYYYGLYTNNITPDSNTVLADLTECTDGSYVSTGRLPPGFTPATLNGDDEAELTGPDMQWTFNFSGGSFTVYGYFVATASSGGTLIYSERAAAPFTVTASGQTFTVTPRKVMDNMP